jgi:ubiquinone biosynthesis protein UbiJ
MNELVERGREVVGRRLAAALNGLVSLDGDHRRRLRGLEGRSLGIELRGPELRFVLLVEDGHFELHPEETEASAWVGATPGGFLSMAASGGRATSTDLQLEGDAESARRFQEFFAGLDPDWEEGITRIFGDVIGFQLSRMLHGGLDLATNARDSLGRNVSEYLREESRQLVSSTEVNEFLDQVDDLRDDVARLEARVRRLAKR